MRTDQFSCFVAGERRFSHKAMQGALMIYFYRWEFKCFILLHSFSFIGTMANELAAPGSLDRWCSPTFKSMEGRGGGGGGGWRGVTCQVDHVLHLGLYGL